MQAAQEGKKEIAKKMIEHLVTHHLTTSQEIADRVKEQFKVITQQYEYFKLKITEYTMSS